MALSRRTLAVQKLTIGFIIFLLGLCILGVFRIREIHEKIAKTIPKNDFSSKLRLIYSRREIHWIDQNIPPNGTSKLFPAALFPIQSEIEFFRGFIRLRHAVCRSTTNSSNILSDRACYKIPVKPFGTEPPIETSTTQADSVIIDEEISRFSPRLHPSTYFKTLELIGLTAELLEVLNSTYWLSSGTLIGSCRHGGVIPWDDDVDFEIPISDLIPLIGVLDAPSYETPTSNEVLARYNKFSIYSVSQEWWLSHKSNFTEKEKKFIERMQKMLAVSLSTFTSQWTAKVYFREKGQPIKDGNYQYRWTYPFIDFFAYIPVYETQMFHALNDLSFSLPLHDLFPLHSRPFDIYALPSTKRPLRLIRKIYGRKSPIYSCSSGFWSHTTETLTPQSRIPCSKLYSYFPFVRNVITVNVKIESVPTSVLKKLRPTQQAPLHRFWDRHEALMTMVEKKFKVNFDLQLMKFLTERNYIAHPQITQLTVPAGEQVGTQDLTMMHLPRRLTEEDDIWPHESFGHYPLSLSESDVDELAEMLNGISSEIQSVRQSSSSLPKFLKVKLQSWSDRSRISVDVEDVWFGDVKMMTNYVFGGDYSDLPV